MTQKQGTPLTNLEQLELLDEHELRKLVHTLTGPGVSYTFSGKRTAKEIRRRVQPRMMRTLAALSHGRMDRQPQNLLIEGENLQAMTTLYKYRSGIDLILPDPPYTTGQDFRYNDKWDIDPNDPELGTLVTKEDGSRHTKWMRFMLARLHVMKDMLKPGGVIAICIDHNELFHLGMMMDDVFEEENRLGIINWQKTYSGKNQSGYVSTATEYILVYAKSKEAVGTKLLQRTEQMDARYATPDSDDNAWTGGDLSAMKHKNPEDYGIQSPFTGEIHYPPNKTRWRMKQSNLKKELEQWGTPYVYVEDPEATLKTLALKGSKVVDGKIVTPEKVLASARAKAIEVRDSHSWPQVFFLAQGEGRPRMKRYLKDVKKGRIPLSYWADEEYTDPLAIGVQSWDHEESGHSDEAKKELNALMGPNHGFDTVKPLKLMQKVIQIWCPPNGIILDPFTGSGTTGHAAMLMNAETGSNRRFILIEQGAPTKGDKYARSLTAERLRRAATGERPQKNGNLEITADPLDGAYEFKMLTRRVNGPALLAMKRDDLIDIILASHFETGRRKTATLIRENTDAYRFLFGRDEGGEGYFVVWAADDAVGSLDEDAYDIVVEEAKRAELKPPYHVYARSRSYRSRNMQFYQVPDRILAHLGFNEYSDPYASEEEEQDNA